MLSIQNVILTKCNLYKMLPIQSVLYEMLPRQNVTIQNVTAIPFRGENIILNLCSFQFFTLD